MPEFTAVALGWYDRETDEIEFDDDSDLDAAADYAERVNSEYIAANPEPDVPYEIDTIGI